MKNEDHKYSELFKKENVLEDLVHTSVIVNLDWSDVKKVKKWLDWKKYKTEKSSGSLYNIQRRKQLPKLWSERSTNSDFQSVFHHVC